MWDKLLSMETMGYMRKLVNDETEDNRTIDNFFVFLKQRIVDYKVLVVLATKWHEYDEYHQAGLAVHYAGMYHASRFIMLMDYLSEKFLKGKLK